MTRQLVGIAALYYLIYFLFGWKWTLAFLLANVACWGLSKK